MNSLHNEPLQCYKTGGGTYCLRTLGHKNIKVKSVTNFFFLFKKSLYFDHIMWLAGSSFLKQGSNPGPLQWKHGVPKYIYVKLDERVLKFYSALQL